MSEHKNQSSSEKLENSGFIAKFTEVSVKVGN